MATEEPDRRIVIRNEFAAVSVELAGGPGHESLRIRDLRHGGEIRLDALELERLTWSRHADLAPILDPANGRDVD